MTLLLPEIEPIATKCCLSGAVVANFDEDRLLSFGVARVRILTYSNDSSTFHHSCISLFNKLHDVHMIFHRPSV